MADGHLNFDTKINTDGFNKGVKAIGNMVSGIGKTVSGLGRAFTPVSVAVGGVGVAAAKTAIDFTKLYESTMVVFDKMLGGKQAANELYGSLLSIAKASTFSQEAFLTAGKKLVGMGIDAQSTTKYMQAITDAVAGFGGTSENLTNVAENFAKISTAGRLSMEDVNMLSDNGIQALKILGNQYGVTTDEMRDMISSGSVPAKEAMDKLAEGIEKGTNGANGMTAAMAGMSMAMKGKTLTGALDSLNSGFRGFALNLIGINPTLKETDEGFEESTQRLQQLTAAISTIAGIMPSVATVFSSFTDGIGRLLDNLVGANVAFDEASGKWQNVGGVIGDLKDKLETLDPDKLKKIGDGILAMAAAGVVLPALGGGISKIGGIITGASGVIGGFSSKITGVSGNVSNFASTSGKKMHTFGTDVKKTMGRVSDNTIGMVSHVTDSIGTIGGTSLQVAGKTSSAFGKMTSVAGTFGGALVKGLGIASLAGLFIAGLGLLQSGFGDSINAMLQKATTEGPQLITKFCEGITAALPQLMQQGTQLIMNVLEAITANLPALVTGGLQIIVTLAMGVAQALPQLIPAAAQAIVTLVQALTQNMPLIIQGALQLIVGLVQGLSRAIPMLIPAGMRLILSLIMGLVQMLPTLIQQGVQLIVAIIQGLSEAIPVLIEMAPQIFRAFVDGIMSVDWLDVGKQILTAIADGIKSIGSSLWNTVKGIFTDGEDEAQEKGKSTGEKYAKGVDGTSASAQASANKLANDTTNAFATTLDANGSAINSAAYGMGSNANSGLQMANLPGTFSMNAQSAASGVAGTLTANAGMAGSSAATLAEGAKAGINAAGMPGSFTAAGSQAGQGLTDALANSSGSVSGAASQVASSAEASISASNFSGTYAAAGRNAMQGLASSIRGSGSSVASAAKNTGMAAINGLKSAQLQTRAKSEGTNFIKAFSNTIKSGLGTVRTAVIALMNAAKTAVSGMSSSGYTAGLQFSTGLAGGIRAGKSEVISAASEVAKAAIRQAKKDLDINSPSRVGAWIGKMYDFGIANGILKNARTISDSTSVALSSLQRQAVVGTTRITNAYSATADRVHRDEPGSQSYWDEWERRQRKINRERDERPVLVDGRKVNRTKSMKGVVMV